eukprot:m.60530 g.60530  ORF g.60530 m.60530 type:complete len:898 (+) comp19194_c0_seq2:73-2766(+)
MSSIGPNSSPPSSPPPFSSDSRVGDFAQFEDETEELLQQQQDEIENAEEEGEDLIGDQMENDYRAIPELDVYESQGLASSDVDLGSDESAARIQAERQMAERDRAFKRGRIGGRHLPGALLDESDELEELRPSRRRRLAARTGEQPDQDSDALGPDEPIIENLEDRKGRSLREWVLMDPTRREIHRRFRKHLTTHLDEHGNNVFAEKIRELCESNGESLVVSFANLVVDEPVLAMFVTDAPSEILGIFDEAAKEVVLESFPSYGKIRTDIHVRISFLPLGDSIRTLRHTHLNTLVRVTGVVTRRTGVFPQLKVAKYTCVRCGFVIGPIVQDTIEERGIGSCPDCQSKGPFSLYSAETVYRNYQRITIQEPPSTVPAGRLPRQKDVILLWDLVDSCKPGDEIELTGIYRHSYDRALNTRQGFPVFSTIIEANYIEKRLDKFSQFGLTDEDVREIRAIADEHIGEKIVRSIAPSIYGHEDIKLALALAMFGGQAKDQAKHRSRGDINVLLLGDPGTAKSQFLKYVEKTAHRAIFTTGQGASAVGLTASVTKDPITREWTLQGGALVLADQGVCLIDEFDKMTDQDRTSIHEAMEQQTISISKAGIITTLHARCSVIAAANPIRGRYQTGLTFSQNVDLTEPILSRFDILCVVKDSVDPDQDERLADYVVMSHMKNHPTEQMARQREREAEEDLGTSQEPNETTDMYGRAGVLSQTFLRKYLLYARQNVHPKLPSIDEDKIAQLYSELRKQADATGSIPITARHIESIIRISEAHARMHLRDHVRDDDLNMAIRVVLTSFIASQKFSVKKNIERVFAQYLNYKKDSNQLLLFILSQMVQDELALTYSEDSPKTLELNYDDFVRKARELQIHDVSKFIESDDFHNMGYTHDEENKLIIKTL